MAKGVPKKPMAGITGKGRQPAGTPTKGRQPATVPLPDYQELRPLWAFNLLDIGGPWCWGNLDRNALLLVMGKLKEFESMNFNGLRQAGCHNNSRYDLIK